MKKFNKREYIILIVCSVLVLIFVISKFIISPLNDRGSDIKDSISLAQKKLDKNQQIVSSRSIIEEQYKKLVSSLGETSSEGTEFSLIVSNLEALAREANIHVANVQPQKAYNREQLRVYPIELEIDGQWPCIAKFLYLVQSGDAYFNIDELNLEKYSDTTGLLRGRVVLSRVRVNPTNS